MGLAGMAVETAGVEGLGSARLGGPADDLVAKELLLGVPVCDHDLLNLCIFHHMFCTSNFMSRPAEGQARRVCKGYQVVIVS